MLTVQGEDHPGEVDQRSERTQDQDPEHHDRHYGQESIEDRSFEFVHRAPVCPPYHKKMGKESSNSFFLNIFTTKGWAPTPSGVRRCLPRGAKHLKRRDRTEGPRRQEYHDIDGIRDEQADDDERQPLGATEPGDVRPQALADAHRPSPAAAPGIPPPRTGRRGGFPR